MNRNAHLDRFMKAFPFEGLTFDDVSLEARYADIAEQVLEGRCPNCGGELVTRPRRPAGKLAKNPASTERIYKPQGCGQRVA